MSLEIKTFFHTETATFTHVVSDPSSQKAAIIDAVLDYDAYAGATHTTHADEIVAYVEKAGLSVVWILETHIHADHLTAASYLKGRLGGKMGIGAKVRDVLTFWVPLFHTQKDTDMQGTQFDHLFEDGESFSVGNLQGRVIYTPGHTPACVSYLIEDAVFVGDTLFMPDVGTARTDFPGGSAQALYASIQTLFRLPPATRMFMCHDYPPTEREVAACTSVQEQKERNIMIHEGIVEQAYIAMRNARDAGKAVPKLLLPALQVNLRGGTFGAPESNARQYIKIPLNALPRQ